MASVTLCDGCMSPVQEPVKIGHVLKLDYCLPCADKAREFVAAEEKLRKSTHDLFKVERQALIEIHGANGFRLPDVPA